MPVLSPMVTLALLCLTAAPAMCDLPGETTRVCAFRADITPPLGQPMFSCDPLRTVEQPLWAKGIVLEAAGQRYVLCALDWCLLSNGSYDAMRNAIAAAAGTVPEHVAVQTVHQHTAPLVDMDAQKLLAAAGASNLNLDPKSFDAIRQRVVAAIRRSLNEFQIVDRIGVGQAKVDRVASSRRPVDASGKIVVRLSKCESSETRAMPEGKIDPYLKTITLAHGERPLVRLHYYATHPQTSYGDGRASSDMVGDAREALEQKENVPQIYFNGCGGDITVGKYNDGSPSCRADCSKRLLAGMEAAVAATRFVNVGPIRWRTYSLLLPARSDGDFHVDKAAARTKDTAYAPVLRVYFGAACVAFHQRSQRPIELTSLELGDIHIIHLPGEPMVCFQQFAQALKPNAFVAVAGYGDAGPGYLCPTIAFSEGGYEPTASRVKPESEPLLKKAIAALLGAE